MHVEYSFPSINILIIQLKDQYQLNIKMADRLTKLSQYLNSQNYELAIELHQKHNCKIELLEEANILKLAKAYHFIANHYDKVLKIIREVRQWKSLQHYYQSTIIQVKSGYLGDLIPLDKLNSTLKELLSKIKKQAPVYDSYEKIINEIYLIINHNDNHKRNSNNANLRQQKRFLEELMNREDDNSIIMEGMPKFMISTEWLKKWNQYTQVDNIQKDKKYPGPMTQFQIIDHPFNIFHDKNQGKQYTNKFIFNNTRYQLFPKKCWLFLKQRYGGIDLKRFNITFINKPNEIMTQVYLKKIQIARYLDTNLNDLRFLSVQITRKQTWEGLANKIGTVWNLGQIYQLQQNRLKPMNESEILQQADTVGKKYIFKALTKKSISKNEKCASSQCQITEKLKFCECKSVKYCSSQCQKQDRTNHRNKCELQKNYLKQQSVVFKNFNLEEKAYGGMKGKVGLKNLGNTCYMNSGLQCLSNTREITQYFMKDDFKTHINHRNPLGMKGNLACTYAELMRQIWTGNNEVVSPFKVKKVIGSYSTQFSGFGQQDSQQFISLLIDCLCQDLNLVKSKQSFEVGDDIKPDEQMSRQSEINYAKRIQSYIRSLMVGQFKSTVTCSACKRISVCFDPYMLITMPIPSSQEAHFFFIPNLLGSGAIKFAYEYNSAITLQNLARELVSAYNKGLDTAKSQSSKSIKIDFTKASKISVGNLYFVLVNRKNFSLMRQLNLSQQIINFKNEQAELMCLQVPPVQSKDQQLFLVEFLYLGKEKRQSMLQRCNLPRFFRLPKLTNPKIKQDLIIQTLSKGFKQQKSNYQDSVDGQKVEHPTETGRQFKTLLIYCRKQFKLKLYSQSSIMNIGKLIEIKNVVSLDDCMHSFIQLQKLTGENTWYCSKCKDHKEATKHMEIYKSNKILVIAFKRFTRHNKIRTPVKFPIENFDIGPYLLSNVKKEKVLYDLYGVVNHYGTLGGGHYTAYCQNFLSKRWYEFNDSRVSEINRSQIISGDSYVLFYRSRDMF